MTIQEKSQIQQVKCRIQQKYPSLTSEDCDSIFNTALYDYIIKKYPSENNRPTPETLSYDFFTIENIFRRMDYMVGKAGVPIGIKEYSENGVRFVFDGSLLSDYFDIGLPKAGVPR